MPQSSTSSSQLPASKTVQTYYVQLPNGKIVTRTADEIAALPPDLAAELIFLNPPAGGAASGS